MFLHFIFNARLKKNMQQDPVAVILEHLKGILPAFLFHAPRGDTALLSVYTHKPQRQIITQII